MNTDLNVLEDLFIRLQNSQIIDYSYRNNILRLQILTNIAAFLLPSSQHINLVLQDCHYLYFLSYTQTQETRSPIDNLEEIFRKGLIIRGIELRNRENSALQAKEGFILYCNSILSTVEAGELHLKASGFQMYDQEFGRVSYPDFSKASDLLKSS